ncbi:hypothetical protein F5888DRAFT_1665492 [Russula emetica]|nr:hypothetical protein F5888DRAFT_1665492 [Russula emetica]
MAEQLVGLVIFALYFLSIFFLFSIILQSISERHRASGRGISWSHASLALVSFVFTWYYMISFLWWSFVDYEQSVPGRSSGSTLVRVANWLKDTALFEQAWTIVCDGPLRWWWSEQLCLFTVGFWTVFLLTTGREHGVRHVWAYMLFGQLVAISVASNLFFLAVPRKVEMKPRASTQKTVPPVLWLSVLASLLTVFLVPHSLRHNYFLSNLFIMHALLVIPLFRPVTSARTGRLHIRTRTLYQLITLLAVIARLRTSLSTNGLQMMTGRSMLWAVLTSHPAQASIGWDVVWTTISFLRWVQPSTLTGQLTVISATALLSIGSSAPFAMLNVI